MNPPTNSTLVSPYLFFEGRCEEALNFYQKAIGAKLLFKMHYKDSPDQSGCPAGSGDKVMHMTFQVGQTLVLASDGRCSGKTDFNGFGLSLTVADAASSEKYFKALSEGGQVQMPLTKTFFSPSFGMVADRFGVMWMVYVQAPNPGQPA
ncbi:VOC family protein [bacterium]|nr:VOC family protein [bacterium]